MQPRIRNAYKYTRIESGWELDIRILDVPLVDAADSSLFAAFNVGSRKIICSSPHKDGLPAFIDVLIHSIRKHGAPSQFICDSSPEFHSAIFEQWASRQQLFLSFVTRGTLGNM